MDEALGLIRVLLANSAEPFHRCGRTKPAGIHPDRLNVSLD